MRISRSIIGFTLISVIFLASCGGGSKNGQSRDTQMVFRYNESGGVTSLDPAFARNVENIWVVHQLFTGLVRLDEDLNVVPDIAKDWEISDEGKEYTFQLRDGVLFHKHEAFSEKEERKVDAEDFVYSFRRIMDRETASPGSYIFSRLDKEGEIPAVEAVNDTTLKIRLKRSFPPFLGLLTMKYCSVVPEEVIEKLGKEDFSSNPIGTGPFRFERWEEGLKMILRRNDQYYEKDEKGNRLPYLDAVSISFEKDRHTAFLQFTQGKYEYLSGVDGSFKDEAITNAGELNDKYKGKFRMVKSPYLKTDYLGMLVDTTLENVKGHPLANKKVRKAINYSINKKEMVNFLRNNIGRPAHSGFIPYGMPSFDPEKVQGYSYDPEKARELLREAGYPNGKGLDGITLTSTQNYSELCEFVQHQLDDIGVKVEVNIIPAGNHREYVATSKLNFFRKSWVADYADGQNFLSLFYSENYSPEGPNYTHFKSAEFDSLYEKAMKETVDSVRHRYYHEMERIVIDHAPVVPLYYDQIVRFIQNDVSGLKSNPMNLLDLRRVKVGAEKEEKKGA